MDRVKLFFITFGSFLAIDAIWLTKVAPKLYKEQIGHLMAENPNLGAAAAFYILYIIGLIVFVIQPALAKQSISYVLTRGALFGLVAYATFDLTCMAVFKDWPLKITLIDLTWGAVLSASVCALATLVAIKFIK